MATKGFRDRDKRVNIKTTKHELKQTIRPDKKDKGKGMETTPTELLYKRSNLKEGTNFTNGKNPGFLCSEMG